jgi:Long-chain fatty acid transport protein
MTHKLSATLSLACLASASLGAGFSLFNGSAAGNADANYATAIGGEPAAQFYNPAAIGGLKGAQLQGGATFLSPVFRVEGRNPYTGQEYRTHAKSHTFVIPHAYYTQEISDKLTFGFALASHFGTGTAFPEDWFGRYNSTSADMLSVNASPALAWRVGDRLTVAAGFTAQYFDLTLKQKIDPARANNPANPAELDITQEISADGFGFGADLGLIVKPVDKLSIGLAYHSRIKQEADGKAEYKKHPMVEAALAQQGRGALFTGAGVKGTVTLPDTIVSAIACDITDKLTLGIGATCQTWSTYDELRIRFDRPVIGAYESSSEKKWSDVWRYVAGGTYKLDEMWTLRASFIYDDSPSHPDHLDYIVPSGDRKLFNIGIGCDLGDWTFDFSYFYEILADDSISADLPHGVMESKYVDIAGHNFGFSATRRF